MKKYFQMTVIFAFVYVSGNAFAYTFTQTDDYSADSGQWTAWQTGNGGAVTYDGVAENVEITTATINSGATGAGAYTFGPEGKQVLPADFGTLTYSLDIYIDPTQEVSGEDSIWSMSTDIRNGSDSSIVDFDFYGKWIQDDGEGDVNFEDLDGDSDNTDWIYKIGRNNDFRTAPVLVESPGWYTFSSAWTDDGGANLINTHTIHDAADNLLFSGTSASAVSSSADGYTSGYMWIYGRDGTSNTVLEVDNISYIAIPELSTLSLFALTGLSLLTVRFLRKRR